MNATKTLICILSAGAALGAAAPVFADPGRDRGHQFDRNRYSYNYNQQYDHRSYNQQYDHRSYNRSYNRDYNRGYYRDYNHRPVVVVRRPYIVEQPAYYAPAYYPPAHYPAPVAVLGAGAIIGAVIGGYIDSQSRY